MAATTWIHLAAQVSRLVPALCGDDVARWLWPRMRGAFPDAIAVTLMPDHSHLVLATDDPRSCEQRLTRLFGHLGRAFDIPGRIAIATSAAVIKPGDKLERQVRYVALNPCRDRHASCPLAWPWSTHRDVVGAIVDPWVSAPRLARALGKSPQHFSSRHHAYVSGDPSAHVAGTPLPEPLTTSPMATLPLRTIAEAAAAAMRQPVAAIRKRGPTRALFVALACDQGWNHPTKLAEVCKVQARAIPALARSVDPNALRAARLCLADARLRAVHRPPSVTGRPRSG